MLTNKEKLQKLFSVGESHSYLLPFLLYLLLEKYKKEEKFKWHDFYEEAAEYDERVLDKMFFGPAVGMAIERVCCFELYRHYPDAYYCILDNKDEKIEIISDTIDELAEFHYNELCKKRDSLKSIFQQLEC